MSDSYGPALPPGLAIATEDVSDAIVTGPALPSRLMPSKDSKIISHDKDCHKSGPAIGPTLPHGFSVSKGDNIGPSIPCDIDNSIRSNIESALSPGLQVSVGSSIGPTMPQGFEDSRGETIGPRLPPGFGNSKRENIGHVGTTIPLGYVSPRGDNSFEDGVIGPLPSKLDEGESSHSAAREFERRAEQMKYKLTHQDEAAAPQRDSWMTELPEEMEKNFGLTSRSFRQKPATSESGDKSVWTDTPSDKTRKEKELSEGHVTKRSHKDRHDHHRSKRDKELAKEVEKYNKSNRSESLLEMHTKERKKKTKKEKEEPKTRRPFDRDADLQVNRFDDAKRRSLIKKSQELDSRFSHGKSKFI